MDDSPRPLRMLVVDDDDIDRERIRRLLARTPLDVEIVEAASGARAPSIAWCWTTSWATSTASR